MFLIAEIGGNHEGDFDYARRLTELACATRCDAVKFQIYTGDTLVSRVASPERNAHFKKFELSRDQYLELAGICRDQGKEFLASVWNPTSFEWIEPVVSRYKVGSGDLTAVPILEATAALEKPVILSCGLATYDEIAAAVEVLEAASSVYKQADMVSLLQCTSMYPIPASEANLRVITELKSRFGRPVGYSDHTEGSLALESAVALGAEILEFHFTDEREGKIFRDHKVSLTPSEVDALANRVAIVEELRGDAIKRPTPSEVSGDHITSFRRAIYPARDLEAGRVLGPEDLVALRPLQGIDARDWHRVLGRTLEVARREHEPLSWEDLG